MFRALGVASAVGVTKEFIRASADGASVPHIAVGALTTSIATRVDTDVVPACHVMRTFGITDAFRSAASQWVADVV